MSKEESQEPKKKGKVKNFLGRIGSFIKKHVLLLIILIGVIIALIIFGRKVLAKAQPDKEEEATTLTTAVEVMDLQSSISVTGTLAAGQSQSVTSTVATGTEVANVYYEVGDYVEAGTVVVEFDSDDYATKLAELNAKYNISDKKNAKELQDYVDDIADYEAQIAEKQEDIAEIQQWLEDNKVYYDDLVDAYNNYLKYSYDADAKSRYTEQSSIVKSLYGFDIDSYEAKQDEIESLEDEIEDLQEQIEEAQYNYELAELQQEYDSTYTKSDEYESVTESQSGTQVIAPFSGYITAINVSEGNNYTQGNTVFTIANTDSFVVEATVDEYDIASISEGLSAVIKFDATDDEEFTGTVSYVAVTSDSTTSTSSSSNSGGSSSGSSGSSSSSSSTSYEVKITLDDTDERLRVGMTAKASVILESVDGAFAVAYDCVKTDSDGNSYVTQVDEEGNETKVSVTLGLESDYYVQIISDELYEGMLVKATASSTTSSDEKQGNMMNMGGGQGGQGGGPGGGNGGGPGGGF